MVEESEMDIHGQQRGSALISVLVILLLTTVLGVIAVRQGSTNLNLAMNASVQSLLVQSSDVVLSKIDNAERRKLTSENGFVGFLRLPGNESNEYIFCYRPTVPSQDFYNVEKDTILLQSGGVQGGGTDGFCKVGNKGDFGSNRRVVMSQVAVVRSQEAAAIDPFDIYERESDPDKYRIATQMRYRVYITSIAPTLSRGIKQADIDKCFSSPSDDFTVDVGPATKSTSDCLFDLGVPSNTQVQDYVLGGLVTVEEERY